MATIFTKIINGEIPSYKIAENDYAYAFLDISPLAKAHTLVVPKYEVNNLFHLDDKNYSELMMFAKRIATAIEKSVECNRVGVAVIGLEVPHAHIHLVPINKLYDIDFKREKLILKEEEMQEIAESIKANFI